MNNFLRKIRYLAEALIVRLFLCFFRCLKVKTASNIAAKISKFVGKKISVHRLAHNNLGKAMPYLSPKDKEEIIDEMWYNLGRIVGEYAFVTTLTDENIGNYVETSEETKKNIIDLKNSGKGGIIFSGHIGNWELGPRILTKLGINVSTVYRPLNNPYVEEMTASMRSVDMIGKNSAGNRKIIEVIKKGGFVIILADQKVSEGEPVKFFHDEAITTTSIARMALKYDIPIIPARMIRVGSDFKFISEVEKPLVIEKTNDINSNILSITRQINQKLENWISEYPSQWFWVHNRWKK